jgi:hypothetical protein
MAAKAAKVVKSAGNRRLKTITKEQQKRVARKAAKTRWKNQ